MISNSNWQDKKYKIAVMFLLRLKATGNLLRLPVTSPPPVTNDTEYS
jgi:hypothetical protein